MTNEKRKNDYKNLVIVALGKFLSGFADYIYDVGIVIYLYDKTGSVAVIGGFFVSQFLPAFVMMVMGGIIDKYNKKMLMIISNFIKGAIFCVLLSNKSIWVIYLITFFINLILEFERSTYSALMVDVFSKEEIFKMSSIINVVDSASLIMGPICASFLATKFDISMNLMIDIVLYVMSALIFSLVKTNRLQETKQSTEIKDMHTYNTKQKHKMFQIYFQIFENKNLLLIVAFWNIFMICIGIASPLEISMIEDTLKMSSAWYGIGNMVEGIGMMIASAFILGKIQKLEPKNIISLGLFTAALSYLMIGISKNIWMYFIGATFVGITSTFCPLGLKTEVQVSSSHETVGRTFTATRFTILISRTIGSLIAGKLLGALDIRIMYYSLAGILILSAVCFWNKNIQKTHI